MDELFACQVIFHDVVVLCWHFSKLIFSKQSFRNSIRVSRSAPTLCCSWSGSKLFAKVISRQQKSPPARKELSNVHRKSVIQTSYAVLQQMLFEFECYMHYHICSNFICAGNAENSFSYGGGQGHSCTRWSKTIWKYAAIACVQDSIKDCTRRKNRYYYVRKTGNPSVFGEGFVSVWQTAACIKAK